MFNFIKTFLKSVTVRDSTVIKRQWYTVNVSEVFYGTDNHEAMNKFERILYSFSHNLAVFLLRFEALKSDNMSNNIEIPACS